MKKILGVLLATLIFLVGANSVFALDISQVRIDVESRSSTTKVIDPGIGDYEIKPKLEFNVVGDFITYKLVLRNNDGKNYKVESIQDDNSNDNIEVTYNYNQDMNKDDKIIFITLKYIKKITNPNPELKSVKLSMKLVDEDDNSQDININGDNNNPGASPKTGDNIKTHIGLFLVSLLGISLSIYCLIKRKGQKNNKKIFSILLLISLIPMVVYASETINIDFNVNFETTKINLKHVVVFDSVGGSEVDKQIIDDKGKADEPTKPIQEHYDFEKWVDEEGNDYVFGSEVTKDLTLYAKWTPKKYKVTYVTNSETSIEPETVKYNETFTEPTAPTKEHYNFGGWYLDATLSTAYSFETKATEDITLYAKWTPKKYKVTYVTNSETSIPTEEVEYNSTFTEPAKPTKEHYDFEKWVDENNNTYSFETKATRDITLTAVWTPKEYTVTYVTNSETSIEPETVKYNETFTEPTKPKKDKYEFVKWVDEDGNDYIFSTKATRDIKLTAEWIELFTVTYVTNSETSIEPETVKYNSTFTEPTAPTKEHYNFGGWYLDATLSTAYSFETKATEDIILYAKWTPKKYKVTYVTNSETSIPTEEVEYNSTFTEPAKPTKTDYVFKGWKLNGAYYNFSTLVTGDITLIAEWQIGKSTLSLDGKAMSTKMKQLANPTGGITSGYSVTDTVTKAFVRADEATYNDALRKGLITDANKVSTSDSVTATYMWFDSSTGTMYYYTEAAKVYINGSMDRMFAKFTNLADWSGLEDFDTSGATDMNRLFQDCPSFDDTALEYIKDWDTSKVTNMTFMFGANASGTGNKITKLTALTDWDVSNVRSFYQAFKHATNLESLGKLVDDPKNPGNKIYDGLGQWDVSSVGYYSDTNLLPSNDNSGFSQMFNGCTSLADASAIVGWDITNAIDTAVDNGKAKKWAFDKMLRTAPVLSTQLEFENWGGRWITTSGDSAGDTGTYIPNAKPTP